MQLRILKSKGSARHRTFRLGGEFYSPATTMPSKRFLLRDGRTLILRTAAIYSTRAAYSVHPGCSRIGCILALENTSRRAAYSVHPGYDSLVADISRERFRSGDLSEKEWFSLGIAARYLYPI